MDVYNKRFSELYDLFYMERPYTEQVDFILNLLNRHASFPVRRVLELACGTASHALILERLGYEVTAIDGSEDMLTCAGRKAVATAATIRFLCQDMRSIDVPESAFDACICLFDSIGYVETNEGLKQTLQGVRRHLRSSGLFLFEFWHAAAMLGHYEPLRIKRWHTSEGEIVRISETKLDIARSLAQVDYTVYEIPLQGSCRISKETHANRFFSVQEMTGWLTENGFRLVKSYDGFTENENITENTWHVIMLARANE